MNKVIKKIFEKAKSIEAADFLINIFGAKKENLLKNEKKLILFGAGSAGKQLLPLLRIHCINPVCFCDNNSNSQNILGIPIINFADLKEKYPNEFILITSGNYSSSIKKQLIDGGYSEEQIFIIEPQHLDYYTTIYQWYWDDSDLLKLETQLEKTYEILEDQKSKDLFIERISLLSKGTDYNSYQSFINSYCELKRVFPKENRSESQYTSFAFALDGETYYFENDVLHFEENESFIDGGAYTGDTSVMFMDYCKKHNLSFNNQYLFEPDPDNFEKLKNNMSKFSNIKLFKKGLWSGNEVLKFCDSNTSNTPTCARIGDQSGDIEIETIRLDDLLFEEKITFIKMDIEGAEIEALKGASEIINRDNPKLAICVYHKRDDIYEIPLLIKKICPDYKFYLRHYSPKFEETILFAVPSR